MTASGRRSFLTGAAALVGTLAVPTVVKAADTVLSPLKWAPRNRRLLSELIANASGTRRPYAVFDWDNTCIFGDCEETLLQYMLETFSFALPPEHFHHVIQQDVPPSALGPNFLNRNGQPISFTQLADDMAHDYAELWSRYGAWSFDRPAVPVDTPALIALRTRLLFSYSAVNAVAGPEVALYWIIRLLGCMPQADITRLAGMANRWALGRDIGQTTYTIPPGRFGKSGPLQHTVMHGLRLTPEIADLQTALRLAGIDVFVCSASLESVVRVFATNPEFGYGLPAENILGIRMKETWGKLGTDPLPDWPLTYGSGKVEAIRRRLVQERGHGPVLVCGDSSGDTAMQTAFPETRLSLIVNRLTGGEEGALSQRAARELGMASPRVLLQGRDENTGEWRPSEETVSFGTRTSRLLAHT